MRETQNAAQVSAADLENERLSEQASLAEFYFELRGQDSLEDVYERTIAADRTSLELTRALAATGIDSEEAVAQAEVTLENAEEAGIGVATNRALYQHAIATLIGTPASAFTMPAKGLTTPVPPIPVGVPSQLLQRRPDVAAAERTMAQANALIGVGKAAYYPTFDLTASVGFQSSTLGTLFSLPALFWSLGASASETIFDGGSAQRDRGPVHRGVPVGRRLVPTDRADGLSAGGRRHRHAARRVAADRPSGRRGGVRAAVPEDRNGSVPDRCRAVPRRHDRPDDAPRRPARRR